MHRLRWLIPFLLTVSVAFAHGPAPTALNAFLDNSGGLRLVHTNIGLATPNGAGTYRYLCPILWGEEEYFPKPIIDREGAIAVPTDGFVYRGDGCGFEAVSLDGWNGQLGGQDGPFVLERQETVSRLWEVSASPRVFWSVDDVFVDSFVYEVGQTVVGSSRGPVQLYRLDEMGESERIELDSPPSGDYVSIRMGEPIWFTLSNEEGKTLYEVVGDQAERRAQAELVLHGPVRWQGGVAWLADGTLFIRSGDQTMAHGPVDWTCLKEVGALTYACLQRDLIEVLPSEDGYNTTPLFALTEFSGVDPQCPSVESELYTSCVRQWFHFGGEAGLLGDERGEGTEAANGSGCQTPSDAPAVPWGLTLLTLMFMRRRRYQGPLRG